MFVLPRVRYAAYAVRAGETAMFLICKGSVFSGGGCLLWNKVYESVFYGYYIGEKREITDCSADGFLDFSAFFKFHAARQGRKVKI
ncbi:MAG: hypothetical protein BM485_15760 [Desulfobulbaceae bacterium DB1]|nr:MAG: hypothetical protein BM485_15760 [Desulfobulbaceae bacterium DB1]